MTTPSKTFRPPAVPLVAVDPFLSIWSFEDHLNDGGTRHWTGSPQHMAGLLRIDGETFSICGHPAGDLPDLVRMPQTGLEVLPTRTIYTFGNSKVRLTLTFLTPALPHDLEWLSRPVTWFVFDVESVDGAAHDVSVYWDMGGEVAVDSINDAVTWGRMRSEKFVTTKNPDASDFDVLSMSAAEQRLLVRSGDNHRIEWGHAYLAVPVSSGETHLGPRAAARKHFAGTGHLPAADEFERPRAISHGGPAMVAALHFGGVAPGGGAVRRHFLFAYDDIFSIEYFHRRLRPWWRRNGADAARLLRDAAAAFPEIEKTCVDYDAALMRDLRVRGGDDYARVCVLAHRQCLAAHKLVADADGSPLYFSKENFSNGCIATVDVTYPSAPFFLALNPALLRAQLDPVLAYASSPRWRHAYAPHDLGTYPLANGQVYGGGELTDDKQMPVEECGNMLILVAAYVMRLAAEGDAAGVAYARRWWPLLRQWAAYLEQEGLDPDNQLCTDDFAGHLAHNANLSLKAIVALGACAKLAALIADGEAELAAESARLREIAEGMAARWQAMADDGDHYRLAFDAPGTWSQKYNLVWDRLLGLDLFPVEVARKEVAFYRRRQNEHGLPLDSRRTYTKLDWIFWSACLTDNDDDFRALIAPACSWVSAGATRVPLADWYETTGDGRQVGFQARSVVGGLYIRQLQRIG